MEVFLFSTNTYREGVKIAKAGSFQRCQMTGKEAVYTKENTRGFLQTSGNSFSLCR